MTPDVQQPTWQPLQDADVPRIVELANEIHASLPERAEVLAEKIALFADGCRRLVLGDRMHGYAIAHPWMLGSIPPLDTFLGALPARPDCVYIHDIAIAPAARGHGAAADYLDRVRAVAAEHRLARLALVSVYGTAVLWERCGFRVVLDPALTPKLASYGPTARYMVAATG